MGRRSRNTNVVLEVYGRRVLWIRLGRNKHNLCKTTSSLVGSNNLLVDLKSSKVFKLRKFKDSRKSKTFYYDWGAIDRLIFKYYTEKKMYYEQNQCEHSIHNLPPEILDVRNEIVEMLFNLVNTIIYTHSFHQQIDEYDLFQDSIEKLIMLLDNDKHNPIRGTSFTFFTIAIKNMIFTQLKKQKRFVLNLDALFPAGGDSKHHNKFAQNYEEEHGAYDLFDPTSSLEGSDES